MCHQYVCLDAHCVAFCVHVVLQSVCSSSLHSVCVCSVPLCHSLHSSRLESIAGVRQAFALCTVLIWYIEEGNTLGCAAVNARTHVVQCRMCLGEAVQCE